VLHPALASCHFCNSCTQVDRIYLSVPSRLEVRDAAAGRTFRLETQGLPDAVVWNPWMKKAASMADFGAPVCETGRLALSGACRGRRIPRNGVRRGCGSRMRCVYCCWGALGVCPDAHRAIDQL